MRYYIRNDIPFYEWFFIYDIYFHEIIAKFNLMEDPKAKNKANRLCDFLNAWEFQL